MMKQIWRDNKRLFTVLAFLFCLISSIALTKSMQVTASANTTGAADYSFYAMSQAAAQFLNQTQDPVNGAELPKIADMAFSTFGDKYFFGNGGGLLGYQDEWESDASFIVSGTGSGNTVVYYYNTLRDNIRIDSYSWAPDKKGDGFVGYGYFGYALSEMGLDETAMNGANSSWRMILGIVMLAMYALSTSVDVFFRLIFGMLRFANPFRLFLGGTSVIHSILAHRYSGIGGGLGNGGINQTSWGQAYSLGSEVLAAIGTGMDELITMVTDFYNALYKMSLGFVIPLMLAIALFSWLVVKKGASFFAVFKPLFIKILFIVLGVPLLFAAYSAALDSVYDFVATNNSVGSKIVVSTFFDFEKWVYGNRLALRGLDSSGSETEITISLNIDAAGNVSLTPEAIANARSYVGMINKLNYKKTSGIDLVMPDALATTSRGGGDTVLVENMHKYNTEMMDDLRDHTGGDDDAAYITAVTNLLQRYASGTVVSAASYQSYVTSALLQKAGDNEELKKEIFTEYAICQNWRNFHPDLAVAFKYKKGDGAVPTGIDSVDYNETQVRGFANKRFKGSGGTDVQKELWSSGGLWCKSTDTTAELSMEATGILSSISRSNEYGMSAMAMYNYLSSSFDDTKVVVYSAANTSSDQVQVGHYAVTTVGTGLMKWIYLIDAIVLLGCSTIIGYGYGLAMLFANFKALFKMIPNVLTGMFGSLRGVASAVALTAAMIVEVIATCLLYAIAMQIIYALFAIIEAPLKVLLTTSASGAAVRVLGGLLPILFGVVSIALVAAITSKLLQWRLAICQATTEACTSFINKFVGTNISAPNLHDGMSLANAGSILASAAMAANAIPGAKDELKERFGAAKDSLSATKDGESPLLTGGTGGVLSDEDKDSTDERTEEEKRNAVKLGNGTGEKKGKDGTGEDGDGDDEWTATSFSKNGSGGGDTDVDEGSVTAHVNGEASVSGQNADAEAADYVDKNREDFERAVSGAVDQQQDAWNEARMNDPNYQAKLAAQDEAASRQTVTDTNGNMTGGLRVVNAETGEAYTQADKDAGAAYSIVDQNGEIYVDSNGQAYENKDSDSLMMDKNGNVSAVADGNGNISSVSSNNNPEKQVIDSNGNATSGLQVVNADTGANYTQADKDSGAKFTVLDSSGQVYTDSNGVAYENMSANNVKLDGVTGQVNAIRDGDGNVSTVRSGDSAASAIITNTETGEKTAGLQIVNAATHNAYTAQDQANGAAFTVLNKDGTIYQNAAGQTMVNQPVSDISLGSNGQVNGVRTTDGTVMTVQNVSSNTPVTMNNSYSTGGSSGGQMVYQTGEVTTQNNQALKSSGDLPTGTAAAITSGATMYAVTKAASDASSAAAPIVNNSQTVVQNTTTTVLEDGGSVNATLQSNSQFNAGSTSFQESLTFSERTDSFGGTPPVTTTLPTSTVQETPVIRDSDPGSFKKHGSEDGVVSTGRLDSAIGKLDAMSRRATTGGVTGHSYVSSEGVLPTKKAGYGGRGGIHGGPRRR